MKRTLLLLIPVFIITGVRAQEPDYSGIDKMIIFGNYEKAVDTCRLILSSDSSNALIWYKMGLASRNLLPDTGSFKCFLNAAKFEPENDLYKFTVAKGYFDRNKNFRARPVLTSLVEKDTLNWQYAFYLTAIYLEEKKYDDAIKIYNRFYRQDSTNHIILDKLGFANLRKGKYPEAIEFYNKSLALNNRNIDAIRNLSFLYPFVNNMDTAILLLDRAIKMDPEDVDLYARRATIYFSKNYTKRALNDYLKILSLGDSSTLYLKRSGIGYMYNLQPGLAVPFLLKAHAKDTSDFETLDFIAQCYYRLNDHKTSEGYYNKLITLLKQFLPPLVMTYQSLAREQKTQGEFTEAISSFSSAYKITEYPYILIYIANIYDENLQNMPKALEYYKQFLAVFKGKKLSEAGMYTASYVEKVRERAEYLEKKQAEEKAKKAYSRQQEGQSN